MKGEHMSENMKLMIWIALVVVNLYIILKHEWNSTNN